MVTLNLFYSGQNIKLVDIDGIQTGGSATRAGWDKIVIWSTNAGKVVVEGASLAIVVSKINIVMSEIYQEICV